MKFKTKQQYLDSTSEAWESLWEEVGNWDLSKVETRIKVVNKSSKPDLRAQSVKDVLAHLHAWHLLLLSWHKAGQSEMHEMRELPDMPTAGYKWNETRRLNQDLADHWADVEFVSVSRRLKLSYGRVMKLVSPLSETQFLKPGFEAWTGKYGLVTYFSPNTDSHYRWAKKKIVAMRKEMDSQKK